MAKLIFTLKLPKGAKSPVVLAAGGADGDGNGLISKDSEVGIFKRKEGEVNVWVREQDVEADTKDMLFAVTFTVGVGVAWQLDIRSGIETLFTAANTTVFPSETVSFFL